MGGMLEGMTQTAFWMPVSEKAGTVWQGSSWVCKPLATDAGIPFTSASSDAHSTPYTPRQKQRWPALTP